MYFDYGEIRNFCKCNCNLHLQLQLNLKFLHLRVIFEVYGLFNSWKPFVFFVEANYIIIATISKKCPHFATRLCFHGNPGNHGNNLKIFSVPLLGQTF